MTPEDDPLMYIVTFMNVTFQIRKHDPKARRFISDVMQEDLLEEFAFVNQKEEYLKLLKKNSSTSENPETQLKLVLATVYGTQRTIQRLINESMELSYDEYFRYMIEILLFALHLPDKSDMVDTLIHKSDKATKQLFKTYPHLLNESDYLYKNKKELSLLFSYYGGQGGIRTLGTLFTYTRFPGVLLQPAQTPVRRCSCSLFETLFYCKHI